MGPSGRITHVIGYIGYIALFGTGICKFCIWVELPVQRRLYPIFVRNVGSPDIHKCFRGLTGSQRTPGFGVSHFIYESVPPQKANSHHTKNMIIGAQQAGLSNYLIFFNNDIIILKL